MLVMRRRQGEAILIGDEVEIRILAIEGSKVKIGITAPAAIPVCAREVQLVKNENRAAALTPDCGPELLARLVDECRRGQKSGETVPRVADVRR